MPAPNQVAAEPCNQNPSLALSASSTPNEKKGGTPVITGHVRQLKPLPKTKNSPAASGQRDNQAGASGPSAREKGSTAAEDDSSLIRDSSREVLVSNESSDGVGMTDAPDDTASLHRAHQKGVNGKAEAGWGAQDEGNGSDRDKAASPTVQHSAEADGGGDGGADRRNQPNASQAQEKEKKEAKAMTESYEKWLKECCKNFEEEIHNIGSFEGKTTYSQRLIGWMRETGGTMQTQHPVWEAIEKFVRNGREKYEIPLRNLHVDFKNESLKDIESELGFLDNEVDDFSFKDPDDKNDIDEFHDKAKIRKAAQEIRGKLGQTDEKTTKEAKLPQEKAKDEKMKKEAKLLQEKKKRGRNASQRLFDVIKSIQEKKIVENIEYQYLEGFKFSQYNICGDLGIHMVFLQSYIQGFGGQPHRELLALGKKLIDERVVKNINAPYISDLKVWKSALDDYIVYLGKPEDKKTKHKNFKAAKKVTNALESAKSKLHAESADTLYHDWKKYHVGSPGIYEGETILHIAIVNKDHESVEWMLENNASVLTKADGLFFMPRLTRRGHLAANSEGGPQRMGCSSYLKGLWDTYKTIHNIETVDDVVGEVNSRSAYRHPDLYFGQYPLSFAVSQGCMEVCKTIMKHEEKKDKEKSSQGDDEVGKRKQNRKNLKSKMDETQNKIRSFNKGYFRKFMILPFEGCSCFNGCHCICGCDDSEDDSEYKGINAALINPKSLEELDASVRIFRNVPLPTTKANQQPESQSWTSEPKFKNSNDKPQSVPFMSMWDEYGSWDFLVNMQDDLGNTPLHIAVMHKKKEMIKWLLDNSGRDSLAVMNKQGLTPFTLAVWLGDVDMYRHIAEEGLSSLLWKYGTDCELRLLNLEQIDSFRMYDPSESVYKMKLDPSDKDHSEKPPGGLKMRIGFHEHLHTKEHWRSAFEIIVEKELRAFTQEAIFDHLVMTKWHSFGRPIYFVRVFLFYIAVLVTFFIASMLRISELKSPEYASAPIVTGMDAFYDSRSGYMFIALASVGNAALLNLSWILLRFKRRDLDRDHDGSISTEEAMMFIFKNLGSICCLASCIMILLIVISRGFGYTWEQDLIACTSVVMFCNVLNIVTPFKFIGVLVLTTFRMLISDIARFIIVYVVLLVGFSTSMFVLFDRAASPDYGGPNDRLNDLGSVMRKMLYISLGEVGTLDEDMATEIQMIVYIIWVILTNVLLLNLLISMMGMTFADNQQDTHNAWVFPVANFIMRCETHIMSRRWRSLTRCGIRGSMGKVERGTGSDNFVEKSGGNEDDHGDLRPKSLPTSGKRGTIANLLNTVNPDAHHDDKKNGEEYLTRGYADYLLPWGMTMEYKKRWRKERRERRFTNLKPGIPQKSETEDQTIARMSREITDLTRNVGSIIEHLKVFRKDVAEAIGPERQKAA